MRNDAPFFLKQHGLQLKMTWFTAGNSMLYDQKWHGLRPEVAWFTAKNGMFGRFACAICCTQFVPLPVKRLQAACYTCTDVRAVFAGYPRSFFTLSPLAGLCKIKKKANALIR